MRLVRLDIQTLPGITPGFTLEDIEPGVIMVTGPNAVGKSSLIRALGYLIGEPWDDDPPALSLAAVLEGDGGRWTVRRAGREIAWTRDGRPVERPALPDRDQLYCYWLSMEELLAADRRDERLLAELRRGLSGGYDLKALRREAPFELRPRVGQSEGRRLLDSEKALREVEGDYGSLRRDEGGIPSIEAEIEAARAAAVRRELLKQALALLEARQKRQRIEAGLEGFPGNMARLRGDELRRLEALEGKREELHRYIEVQVHVRDGARVRLEETGLAEDRPERPELEARGRDLERGRRGSEQREQEQRRLEQVEATAQQALAHLGGRRDIPRLDPDSVSEAEALAVRLQAAELRRRELAERLQEAGEVPDHADIDCYLQAAEALRGWLAAEASPLRRLRAAIAVGGAGGLLAVAASFLAEAWLALVGGAVALVGLVWLWLQSRAVGGAEARRRFEATGLDPPRDWRREPVEARRREIESRRAEFLQQLVRAQEAEELRRRFTRAEAERQSLQERKNALADRLGFDPTLTAAALDRFVRLVQDYERAHRECQAARATIERLGAEIGALGEGVGAFLDRWRAAPADRSPHSLDVGLANLRGRLEQTETAAREMREAEGERQRLQNALDAVDDDEAALFREAGLEPGRRADLARCFEQLEDWREQQERFRKASVLEAERGRALEGEDALLTRVEADDRIGMERELAHAGEEASRLEARQEELTTIRTRLREAGRDRRLERALSEVDTFRTVLEDRYREALLAEAAQLLIDGVEKEHRSEHQPEILSDARERFRRFTHHAFDLELDESDGFIARDLQQQARRSLSELSSATRMQLLLAVRLAWTRGLERGREALPLFLDEALTTSDEGRFSRVAESLDECARGEGRQIFYLSARGHEVALWERATGSRPHHIDLARVRFGRTLTQPDDYLPAETEPLPAPESRSPESYAAALGVPPADPREPEGNLHPFHLLRDDLPLLHHLMENWRVRTLGQLEGLLRSSAATDAIADSDRRRRLEGRCAAARAWVEAWRRGRGKPVDRIALEHSGAVSATFLEAVAELVESVGGDGTALIAALRAGGVARFRAGNTDDLERWLEAAGHIDPQEPLAPEDREFQTLLGAAAYAESEEIRLLVRWLEAGLNRSAPR